MSWDIRRLSLAIENAVLYAAAGGLVMTGYWRVAAAAVLLKFIDNLAFTRDWNLHGSPRK